MMLYYQRTGSGKPIIFIHGNSQSLGVWDDVITNPLLSAYTRVAVDLPGHGRSFRSTEPETDYSLKGLGKHLNEFLQQFDNSAYIIVATSMGTAIFGEALKRLKNCKGALLIGACLIGESFTPADILLPNPNAMVSFIEDPSDEQLEKYLHEVIFNKNDLPAREKYKRTFLNTDKIFRSSIANCVAKGEWTDHIKNTGNLPVALVYGKEEAVLNTQYLKNVNLNKWQDKIIQIEAAGHSVQLDQPGILADMIAEFASGCFKPNDYAG